MSLIDRVKSLFSRPLSLTEPEAWSQSPSLDDVLGPISGDSVLSMSTTWACVNLIAGTIGSVPLTVNRKVNGFNQPDPSHRLYRVLRDSPNADQTALDFWEFIAASVELWGNAFAVKETARGETVALHPIPPDLVTVRRASSGEIEYRWTDGGRSETRPSSEMFHVRGFGGSALGGMSTLHFGRHAFGLARAVDHSARSTFANGMRPSGVLTFKEWLSDERREIAEKRLVEKFVGAINSGRPLTLEGGTEWKPLTINPEDAQMLESRRFSVEEICRFFGVPPHMVGHTENSTSWGTGLEQQSLGFQKFTLRRRLRRIEQAIAKQLLTPADRAAGVSVEFNVEGLLRADSAGRASFYQAMTGMGAMTINEVRALENLPPVPGGDQPRMQMQNVPITEAGNEPV